MNEPPKIRGLRGLTAAPIVSALLFAAAFFVVTAWETAVVERNQRAQLIDMTNSFVTAFSAARTDDTIVPATFRRMGIDHYAERPHRGELGVETTVTMPGTPGLEIHTSEPDARLKGIIQRLASKELTGPIVEHRIENGNIIGRTISPSIANSPSCVDCHNRLMAEEVYELGDVMGAFIVESNMTASAWRSAGFAALIFVVALVGTSLLARREQRRMQQIVQGLEAQVHLEQVKSEAEAQQRFLLSHDPLTGLPNRAMFRDRLDADLRQAPVPDVVVIVMDLDGFKTVNDTSGHNAGDALLCEVAQRLLSVIPEDRGLVARLGGDEFAAVLRCDQRQTEAGNVGAQIVAAMQADFEFDNNVIKPGCSAGLAIAGHHTGGTAPELLRDADAALYTAKTEGKNTYRIFDAAISASLGRRSEIAARLPQALTDGDIRAVFQPKICIATGLPDGFEALARWRMDDENVGPDEFIPIAENSGIIRELDLAILRIAAEFAVATSEEMGHPIRISSNLSAQNFHTDTLAEDIMAIVRATGLPPDDLTLEVTESVAVENWDAVEATLKTLRQHGIRAALDDFGTGYSSLSYLRRFEFEEIKIDRSFITNINDDDETRFLFESITDMARGLGATVVVEGVETINQAEIVAARGAQIGQGYLYSKPLEWNEARAFLMSRLGRVA